MRQGKWAPTAAEVLAGVARGDLVLTETRFTFRAPAASAIARLSTNHSETLLLDA